MQFGNGPVAPWLPTRPYAATHAESGVIMSGWFETAKTIYVEADRKKLMLVAAGVAFYGLLGLFPGIGALMALAGIFVDPQDVASTLGTLDDMLPPDAASIITGQAEQVASSPGDGLGLVAIFGLTLTLYSASKGMQALMDGLNLVHGQEETRSFVKTTAVKLALTFGLLVGVLLCIGVAVVVPIALSWLPLTRDAEFAVTVARWPILLCIAAAGIALVYRVAPAGDTPSWRWILPGAALACLLWLMGTGAFAVYVRMFGSYQETFGALGGVVILLMWLWVSSLIVLLGALVSKVLRDRRQAGDDAGLPSTPR